MPVSRTEPPHGQTWCVTIGSQDRLEFLAQCHAPGAPLPSESVRLVLERRGRGTETMVVSPAVRFAAAVIGGLLGGYVTARIDVAVRGPCAAGHSAPYRTLACLPPDPNWFLAAAVAALVGATIWGLLFVVARRASFQSR
jgi:hypothetical protein